MGDRTRATFQQLKLPVVFDNLSLVSLVTPTVQTPDLNTTSTRFL